MRRAFMLPLLVLGAASSSACSSGEILEPQGAGKARERGAGQTTSVEIGQASNAFASAESTLVDFTWDGELLTDWQGGATNDIRQQVLYTVGQLNGHDSVGQMERLVVSNVVTAQQPGGRWLVTYHATMPVAWNNRYARPSTFTFTLPRSAYWEGLVSFAATYGTRCVDRSAHDVDAGSMFYFYRPRASGCSFAPGDVVSAVATVAPSLENTVGKYPEYHRIWQDDSLEAVVVFGKYDEGATTSQDYGIRGYNLFIAATRQELARIGTNVTTDPPVLSPNPGVAQPDVTLRADMPYGKSATIHILLSDNVSKEGPAWNARFAALTPKADVILYNGHSGLGANIRNLLGKGSWEAGQYLIFFMNGCDTFAYVDGRLREARQALNPDDPTSTKYLDMVTNAMPSYADAFDSEPVLLDALLDWQNPKPYTQIFRGIDRRQVVIVTGEEDNEFVPGTPVGTQNPPVNPGPGDAGSGPKDGGPKDSGVPGPRPGSDSGVPGPGARPAPEVGTVDGCGCETAPTGKGEGGPLWALALSAGAALVLARRKRG